MSQSSTDFSTLAETVCAACLEAAMLAYEDAGIRGLCADGRWEAALTAIRQLEVEDLAVKVRDAPLEDRNADRPTL